jgi:hypothetical protein
MMPTQAGLPAMQDLAFSQSGAGTPVVDYPDTPPGYRWRWVIGRAGAFVTLVTLGAAAAVVLGLAGLTASREPTPPVAVPAAEMAVPEPTAPAADTGPPRSWSVVPNAARRFMPDDLFNSILKVQSGIEISDGSSSAQGAKVGHDICRSLAEGWSGAQIVTDTLVAGGHFSDGTLVTAAQVQAFVDAAEQAICPEYAGR